MKLKQFISLFKLVRSVKGIVMPVNSPQEIGNFLEKKRQFVKENDGSYTHGFVKVIVSKSGWISIGMNSELNSHFSTIVADISQIDAWISYMKTFKR